MAPPVTDATRSRRRRWVGGVLLALALVSTGLAIAAYVWADRLIEHRLRPATIDLLSRRFDSEVELNG